MLQRHTNPLSNNSRLEFSEILKNPQNKKKKPVAWRTIVGRPSRPPCRLGFDPSKKIAAVLKSL